MIDEQTIEAIHQNSPQVTGVTVGYPGGFRFRVAFAGGFNEKFVKALREEVDPYTTAIAADALTEETARRIVSRAYVRGIILEWESDEEGVPPPLEDVDAASKWLRADLVMFEDIEGIASDIENFRRPEFDGERESHDLFDFDEADGKNDRDERRAADPSNSDGDRSSACETDAG